MNVITVHPACPKELADSIASARTWDEAIETQRPLAYHSDCLVSIARCKCSGLQVVVKSYMKALLSSVARQQVDTETHIHSTLQHEHVVPLLLAAEDSRCIYMVISWADGGDLRGHMAGMSERRLREFVVAPLLQALVQLHAQGVVHRDIKPDNVLVHQGRVLLADFGLAVYHDPSPHNSPEDSEDSGHSTQGSGCDELCIAHPLSCACSDSSSIGDCSDGELSADAEAGAALAHQRLKQRLGGGSTGGMRRPASSPELLASAGGTPLYTAPEVLLAMFQSRIVSDVVGHKNDVWALAMMALESLTGHHPFSHDANVLYSIAHHTRVKLPTHISRECSDFLAAALQRDPCLRPTAAELLEHPWITGVCDRRCSASGTGVEGGSPRAMASPSCRSPDGYHRRCATTANILMGSSPTGHGYMGKGAGREFNYGGVVMSAECWEY
uniref:Protein kinase domain-containing protein n=1 Tax=Chlamydomonas leiostraca TaxID=1034604 RepID=A0A7S0X010_9CHLO|mmetsp:Transcript_5535/g.13740  ORF Transcript_5535/g.13740 Transcript_5535/m.13740 type:complete len:442 (+) Transcript_5535:118-1443(+)